MQPEVGTGSMHMLAYQRNGDRAMMEKVLENMDAVANLSTDFLSKRSAALLRKLLALEAEAAEGRSDASNTEGGHFFRLGIPYFGTIQISSDGDVVSLDACQSYTTDPMNGYAGDDMHTLDQMSPDDMASMLTSHQQAQSVPLPSPHLARFTQPMAPQLQMSRYPTMIDDALNQQYPYPGLTADPEQWIFQSADTVFFDNLMRSSGMGSVSDSGSGWTN
jgi:hypothetical protein